jgi:hypothetical protein
VVLAIAAVVVIGVGAVVVPKLLTNNTNPQPSGSGPAAGSGLSTGTPTTGPTASGTTGTPTGGPAPTDPFAGTPAAGYAKGADGIVLPDNPPAVAGFTTDEVTGDLATVKQALVAARLDPRMLVQHDTSTLLGLLASSARPSVTDSFAKNQQFSFATWLGDTTALTGDPVRVKGNFTVTPITRQSSSGTDIHEMDVTTNFIWVYPVAANRQGTGANLIVVHDLVVWTFAADAEVAENSQGLFFRESHAFGSNLDCTRLQQGGLVAISPTIHTTDAGADSQAHSPFNPDADVAQERIVC